MPRLIAYGCSFTYGHGLPDCIKPLDRPGKYASKFAWPQLLSEMLQFDECINLSKPGSGNFEMLMRVLGTEFKSDDIVIIAWSCFERFNSYRMKMHDHTNSTFVNPWDPKFKEEFLCYTNIPFYRENTYWNNWLAMHHAEIFLNNKNIKNFSYLGVHDEDDNKLKPSVLNFSNMLDIDLCKIDLALDNKHPGLESHRLQAETIYNKIKDRI